MLKGFFMSAETSDAVAKNTKKEKQAEQGNSKFLDIVLWSVVVVLLLVAIGGNYYVSKEYADLFDSNTNVLIKGAVVIVLIVLACVVALFTKHGKALMVFAKESYIEVRRVVWPTGIEARKTTIIVGVVTLVVSCMLWLFDSVFMHAVSMLISSH